MIVLSKVATLGGNHNNLGPLDSIQCTCYELGHTWNSSCISSQFDIFRKSLIFSLKLYAPFYTAVAIWKLRKKNVGWKKLLRNTVIAILRSTMFLAMNSTYFMMAFCLYYKVFGKFHGVFGLVVGFICSYFSVLIEKKSRRSMLAVYALNLTMQTMFKTAVSRGYLSPINRGEIYLFTTISSVYMGLFRGSKLPAYLQSIFCKIFGSEETSTVIKNVDNSNWKLDILQKYLNSIWPSSKHCRHANGCLFYVTFGAVKYFVIGYLVNIIINYRKIFRALVEKEMFSFGRIASEFSLAKFLGAYIGLFKFANCALRRSVGRDHPEIFGSIAGLVAGISSVFYPSTAISMYGLSKLLDILCMKAVSANFLPYFPNFDSLLYGLSTCILVHVSIFEPHNNVSSYWAFMKGLSGNSFPLIFRKLLDRFGNHSSKLYPDFIPNLDPKNVKSDVVKSLLAQHGKHPKFI